MDSETGSEGSRPSSGTARALVRQSEKVQLSGSRNLKPAAEIQVPKGNQFFNVLISRVEKRCIEMKMRPDQTTPELHSEDSVSYTNSLTV